MNAYWLATAEEDRLRAALAIQLIAAATGVKADRMLQPSRLSGTESRARRLAMYLAYVAFGWPLERVALAFGMNRATAARACRWAEEERDRPTLDAALNRLERCVREVLDAPLCEVPA